MPCDYSKYPSNWHSEIRPAILKRAGNCCERCKAPNRSLVCRGIYCGVHVWQDEDGNIYDADTGEILGDDYVGEVWTELPPGKHKAAEIVLTIAHIHNPDPMDCRPENLQALCQRCHLKLDEPLRREKSKATREKRKKQGTLFNQPQ